MKTTRLVAVLLVLSTATTAEALAADAPIATPMTDGPVTTLAAGSGHVYVGGSFRYAGPLTGSAARLDGASGAPNGVLPFIEGPVMATTPDGSGGWFIGGTFTRIAGRAHGPLAHVRADGSVDPAFDPYPNGGVASLLMSGNRLFVGGYFSIIGGLSRNKLAAVDPATGAVDPSFDANVGGGGAVTPAQAVRPSSPVGSSGYGCYGSVARPLVPNGDGVLAMVVSGTHLFIGGSFAGAGGAGRLNFAALDPATGRADPNAWQTNPDGPVYSMAASDSRLYVGGDFQQLSGLSRSHLAAFELATGNVDTNFQAAADGRVNALAVTPTRLFVGGGFGHIGGTEAIRLAGVSLASGAPIGGVPGANGDVSALLTAGNRVYVAGGFDRIASASRRFLAALDASTGALDFSFAPSVDEVPGALAAAANGLFIGGVFDSVGGAARAGLAALDGASGALLSGFAPPLPNATVAALVPVGDAVFVVLTSGGYPEHVSLVSVDAATGAINAEFKPPALSGVPQITTDGHTLYLMGARVPGRKVPFIALNAADGTLRSNFKPKDFGNQAVVYGKRLLVAGRFSTGKRYKTRYGRYLGTVGLRAFDKNSGKALPGFFSKLPWGRSSSTSDIFLVGKRLIVRDGLLQSPKSHHDRGLSAVDAATGRLIPGFKPGRLGGNLVSSDGKRIYVSTRPGVNGPGALFVKTGKWDNSFAPKVTGQVCDIQPAAGNLFFGGTFQEFNGRLQPNLAATKVS